MIFYHPLLRFVGYCPDLCHSLFRFFLAAPNAPVALIGFGGWLVDWFGAGALDLLRLALLRAFVASCETCFCSGVSGRRVGWLAGLLVEESIRTLANAVAWLR